MAAKHQVSYLNSPWCDKSVCMNMYRMHACGMDAISPESKPGVSSPSNIGRGDLEQKKITQKVARPYKCSQAM